MSNVNPKVIEKFVELNAPMHRTMDEIREYLIRQRNSNKILPRDGSKNINNPTIGFSKK